MQNVTARPKIRLSVYLLLLKKLIRKQQDMTMPEIIRNIADGEKYRAATIPAHSGIQIRRKGISLCSTICSDYETQERYEKLFKGHKTRSATILLKEPCS
jgi:hypothetical protein